MKKLIIPFLCFILLAFVSSTGAWNTSVMVGGQSVTSGLTQAYLEDWDCTDATEPSTGSCNSTYSWSDALETDQWLVSRGTGYNSGHELVYSQDDGDYGTIRSVDTDTIISSDGAEIEIWIYWQTIVESEDFVVIFQSTNNDPISIACYDDDGSGVTTFRCANSADNSTIATGLSEDTWYKLKMTDINFTSDTFDVEIFDMSDVSQGAGLNDTIFKDTAVLINRVKFINSTISAPFIFRIGQIEMKE